jgi:hypothetical protein
MNRKERVDLNRTKRRAVWLFLFLMGSFYWIKCLYEDMDSMNFNNSLIQNSITIKDTIIVNLNKKVDSLKKELTKPIEIVIPPKPKWVKKDTTHVDSLKIKIKPDTIDLIPDTLKKPSN